MNAVQRAKDVLFGAADLTGITGCVGNSGWRRTRLLILCYHSISVRDEHLWRPNLFMSLERFERRLEIIEEENCRVLPLGEAIQLLRNDELPRRAVALTFDDGTAEFQPTVWPLLESRGFPATVYLTTYYAERQFPVFNVAIRYALWKAGARYDVPEVRARNGAELNEEAQRISDEIGFDWAELIAERMFHIMTPEQVGKVADEGCDIQLHTHRHRSPGVEDLYRREIRDNRRRIEEWTGLSPVHFCYPSGNYRPEFADWLRKEGVRTAVTTDPGLVTRASPPLELARFVDTMAVSERKFRAWLNGTAELLPRRRAR